jgi:hypothetical protein
MSERALAVNEVIDVRILVLRLLETRAEYVVGNRVSGSGENLYGTMVAIGRLNLNKTQRKGPWTRLPHSLSISSNPNRPVRYDLAIEYLTYQLSVLLLSYILPATTCLHYMPSTEKHTLRVRLLLPPSYLNSLFF